MLRSSATQRQRRRQTVIYLSHVRKDLLQLQEVSHDEKAQLGYEKRNEF
jgi:hypothetical protein